MKEITHIHIAKVAYDVELPAKKDLEAYLKTLEAYSNDTDIIEDIEIRITEILAERGIKKGGVITGADVTALKHQLGEPREFLTDGDIVVGPEDETKMASDPVRKLYRNTDNVVVGGVLSGLASFYKIDPIWMRLAFIVLLFASFGTALLVYVVLWIVVPPTRTAADKLQMAGRAVTVGSIRALNENEVSRPTSRDNTTARRALAIVAGIICVIGATGAAMATATAIIAVVFGGQHHVLVEGGDNSVTFFTAALVLAVVSGLLLTVLFILGAYAAFAQKMTRRVLISVCIVIVLGLMSFGAAIGLAQYGGFQRAQDIQANTREADVSLPAGIEAVTSLVVNDAQHLDITYVVTSEKPSAKLKTVLRDNVTVPQPVITIAGNVLHVDAKKVVDKECQSTWWCERSQQAIVIYGPALGQVTAKNAATVNYAAGEQDELTIAAEEDASVIVSSGTIKTLKVTALEEATVIAAVATIQNLEADVRMSANVEAGTVQTLIVTDLNSCPARTREARVNVSAVMSGTMTLNGVSQPANSIDSGCTEIEIQREGDEK